MIAIRATTLFRAACLMASAAVYANAASAQASITIGRVARQPVENIADLSLGALRLLAPDGTHAVLPYAAQRNVLTDLFVPWRGEIRHLKLRTPIDSSRVGPGCLNPQEGSIEFTEVAASGAVVLHTIRVQSGAQERVVLVEQGPTVWAGFDCTAFVLHERGSQGELLRYVGREETRLASAPRWQVALGDLFDASPKPVVMAIHLERDRVNVIAGSAAQEGPQFFAALANDGKPAADTDYSPLTQGEVLRVLPTSYGYAAELGKSLFQRSSRYLILDSTLKATGRVTVTAPNPPLVRLPGRSEYLVPNLTEVNGKPRLEFIGVALDGRQWRDAQATAAHPALTNVIFGTTVLGLVGRDLVVVARGVELEKLKQGFMLRDAVYSFGIALDR